MTSCVYLLYNVEGFIYIGQTTNLHLRLHGHRSNYKANGLCASKLLGRDWDVEILEECEDLADAERFYYDFYYEICPEMIVNRNKPGRTAPEYYQDNRERVNRIAKEYFSLHHKEEAYRQRHNKSQKKYAEKNREKLKAYHKQYHQSKKNV